MPTFGFSAYLKFVSLSERRQRSEARNRLISTKKAYDYHRSLRLCAKKLLIEEMPIEDVLGIAEGITKPAERNSAKIGLAALQNWRSTNLGDLALDKTHLIESPNKIFSVKFTPDFKIEVDGAILSIHLWNTKAPALVSRQACGAMSLFKWFYTDLAVLDLRKNSLIKLSDAEDHSSVGRAQLTQAEVVFQKVLEELKVESASIGTKRPAAPLASPF